MVWPFSVPEVTPLLRGKRLSLRAPRMGDYKAWYDLRMASREYLTPFEPRWSEADMTRQRFADRVRRSRADAAAGTEYAFFIFEGRDGDGPLVGGATLSNVRRRVAQFANLGYWTGQRYAGQGYMTEAVATLLPFVFEVQGLNRLHAAFMPHNIASRRVLEKNGFKEEGFAEAYLHINGQWADHVLFGLTRDRYLAARMRGGR